MHDGLAEGFDFGDMRSRVETMFESQEVEVEWDEWVSVEFEDRGLDVEEVQ